MIGLEDLAAQAGSVDLHAHVPMHVRPRRGPELQGWQYARDRSRHFAIGLGGLVGNLRLPSLTPRMSLPLLERGGVGVALSVLYLPLDEMHFSPVWHARSRRRNGRPRAGLPGDERIFARLMRQLRTVEREVADNHVGRARIARDPEQVAGAVNAGEIAVVHAVEGAFQLGGTPEAVDRAVTELADRGVVYITLGHLFMRGVSTVVPCWQAVPPQWWDRVWRQPDLGLTELGVATVRAMTRERVAVDVMHLTDRALRDTFALLDEEDPERRLPVLGTHAAVRGRQPYNLEPWAIEAIAARDGVVGIIFAGHNLADGLGPARNPYDTVDRIVAHAERIRAITGSMRHVALGSDLGGFIGPAPGLEDAAGHRWLRERLAERLGEQDAAAIAAGNALRVIDRVLSLRSERGAVAV